MSLGFDHVEPNRIDRCYRPPSTTPASVSHMTDIQDSRWQSDDPSKLPRMFARPYAPSPPEPTCPSIRSDDEYHGPERYAGHRFDSPEYASSNLGLAPPVQLNSAPFMMPMQMNSLLHRDFKDELTRAAGTVTPGVSDAPYIRYAIDAITRERSEGFAGAGMNSPSGSDIRQTLRSSIKPSSSIRAPESQPAHQPQAVALTNEEAESSDLPIQFPSPDSFGSGQRVLSDRKQPTGEPVGKLLRETIRGPVRETAREPATRPERSAERTRIDELVDGFNRAKALVLQSRAVPPKNPNPPRTADIWLAQSDSLSKQDVEAMPMSFRRLITPSPLTNKPWILRSISLLMLMTFCILMITALVFSAIYSIGRDGFTPYDGTIYGGQYFLFRVLPQLIGAALLIYAQCVINAMLRIFPFSAMASDDRRERHNAVFLPLYPAFLWPHLFGPWNIWVPTLVVWLANFTIPLLSSLYTVVLVDDVWVWSTVQGVAWTLVAVYTSLLLTTVSLFAYWRRRRTGMAMTWDARSIADVIFLSSQSNSLPQYWGLEMAATRSSMKKALDGTAERLGYWTTPDFPNNGFFWSFGVPTAEEDLELEKWDKKKLAAQRNKSRPVIFENMENQNEPWAVRFRYLPWCFRDGQILLFVTAGTLLLIALIIVSFLHSTDLRNGFLPGLIAAPLAGAFSPADFLYSFLPSLIGLALFLGFQSLDLTLRILEPWGELAREKGSRAEKSLLLDYAACLPWQCTFKAIRYRHWRMAFVTFLTPLFILLPVLSGGLFMALTPPSGVVRVFPNVPIFALILTLLFLYLAALISLIPNRKKYRLPHAVTCLAEIMSFCCSDELRTDKAFNSGNLHRRKELEGALDCGKDWHRQGRWTFGTGKNKDERLGIKRFSKYTVSPRTLRQYDRYVRGKTISGPLLHGSGPLFGH
ncbi:hypothetical protein GGS21DRAFT_507061 [Xylaria nigripes]|nr:hypothetical protein GGS21DRAFT_507061 [Xylaria nigripes]